MSTLSIIAGFLIAAIAICIVNCLAQSIADKVLKCNTYPEPYIFSYHFDVKLRQSEVCNNRIHSYTGFPYFKEMLDSTSLRDNPNQIFVEYLEYLKSYVASVGLRVIGDSRPDSNIFYSIECKYECQYEIDPTGAKSPKLINQRLF